MTLSLLRRFLIIAAAPVCCVVLSGCDPAYGPVIANGCAVSITIRAAFSDGKSSDGVIPSGSDFWQRIEGRHLSSLVVTTATGAHHTYTSRALDRLRHSKPVKDELWIVSASDIRLEDLRQIKAIRKTLPKPQQT
jgi:hypothetical protein